MTGLESVSALFHRGIWAWVRATRRLHPSYGRAAPLSRWPAESRVQAGALRLHQLEWPGPRAPVVLLHGLNNTAWICARCADGLAAGGRRVLAPTLRGHGASDQRAGPWDLETTSADLCAWLDALGLEQVDLVGHSWGGKVALHLAATRPARVRRLILADPVPPAGLAWPSGHRALVQAAFLPERRSYADDDALERGMARLVQHQVGDDTDRAAWRSQHVQQVGGGYRPALTQAAFDAILRDAIQADVRPLLPALRCPVLLLRPTFHLSPDPRAWREARALWPALREERILGDHTFIHTHPAPSLAALTRFLDA